MLLMLLEWTGLIGGYYNLSISFVLYTEVARTSDTESRQITSQTTIHT
jgi:hypothetical protein